MATSLHSEQGTYKAWLLPRSLEFTLRVRDVWDPTAVHMSSPIPNN